MTARNHATRLTPCQCAGCRSARRTQDVAFGILVGLAAVGVLVAAWALLVIVWAVAG